MTIILLIVLFLLFLVLGLVADRVVFYTKILGYKLDIKLFFLGLILGVFTNLPELFVALSSVIEEVPEISLGNLFGGLIVLFGLILGVSIILNKKIETDGKVKIFLPIVLYIFLPLVLAWDGGLGFIDGIILIIAYFSLVIYLYYKNHIINNIGVDVHEKKDILRYIFYVVIGIVGLLLVSNFIIKITTSILDQFQVSGFMIGLLVFSIGTNLPEISISFQSWRKSSGDLSLSSLIGAAMANRLVVGILATMNFVPISLKENYYFLTIVTALILIFLFIFYRTGKQLSRKEGVFLVLMYLFFLVGEIFFYLN